MRPCVIVPHYRHETLVGPVLAGLARIGLPVIVVDDGSPPEGVATLRRLIASLPQFEIDCLPVNRGKGAAVMRGLALARSRGYTHAIQVDADGQHCLDDMPKLLAASGAEPQAIVSGRPIFDATVPRARLHGRKISVFWARLATWSNDIEDSMCGFRVYPISPLLVALGSRPPGSGMEFDTEVLVRAHWAGLPLRFVPTAVTYPPNGVSHYRMVRDNVRMTLMHTRLMGGMLVRVPRLLLRTLVASKAP
jgi:glycosyltransferase involved in cell wall biosynthesis